MHVFLDMSIFFQLPGEVDFVCVCEEMHARMQVHVYVCCACAYANTCVCVVYANTCVCVVYVSECYVCLRMNLFEFVVTYIHTYIHTYMDLYLGISRRVLYKT